jgi:hypothetical protein
VASPSTQMIHRRFGKTVTAGETPRAFAAERNKREATRVRRTAMTLGMRMLVAALLVTVALPTCAAVAAAVAVRWPSSDRDSDLGQCEIDRMRVAGCECEWTPSCGIRGDEGALLPWSVDLERDRSRSHAVVVALCPVR